MPIEIVNAKQSDLEYVLAHPMNPAVVKGFSSLRLSGWCKTVIYEGNILGVGGVVVYWPGVGEGYYILSEHAREHKVRMALCLKRIIALSFEELNLHRLQATVRKDFTQAAKLIEQAGFELEGNMKKYTPDKIDTYLYAFTK